jgi:hypothetical protein
MPDTLNGDNTYGVDIDLPASYPTSDIGVIVQARDFSWCRKINVAGVNPSAESGNVSLYPLNTSHTINSKTGYQLVTYQGSIPIGYSYSSNNSYGYIYSITTAFDIFIVHSDGSETQIGSGISSYAQVLEGGDGGGLINATWNCPETNMEITDAIKVVLNIDTWAYTYLGSDAHFYLSLSFITNRLGWTKLKSSTWDMYRYIYGNSADHVYGFIVTAYWGNSTYDMKIIGVQYESPVNQDYWGQFFADSGKNYYIKNPTTGVMTLWTPGNMTYGSQATWDPILNISPLCGWDKGNSPTDKVRLFASIGYGIYDSSESEAIVAHTIGSYGISEVDYAVFLKNYGGE